jgi:probable phosphoglycerate mutase
MQHIYLVRHGETTYNEQGLVQDGSSLLTDRGTKQAHQVAERLRHLDFQNLVVSDYERTKQTAQPVAELTGVQPEYSALFREIRRPSEFFHTERTLPGFQSYLHLEYQNFVTDPTWRHSDEENFVDSSARASQALEYLTQLDGDTVVISHGHFIRMLTATVACNMELDGPTWQKMYRSFKAVNTGITTLLYDPTEAHWQILTFNDHAHFAE